jgi:hypothetical protein
MASTFDLIASNTTTTAASLTFGSIPSTYTDLCIIASVRTTYTGDPYAAMNTTFNSITSGYNEKTLNGSPANSPSGRTDIVSNASAFQVIYVATDATTANTFASVQIYIPNYAGSTGKSISYEFAPERSADNITYGMGAGFNATTSAISSIKLEATGGTFVSGTTFHLYGIKNS